MSSDRLLGVSSIYYPDEVSYKTNESASLEGAQDYLIFFLPGNPGLMSYYEPFLSQLKKFLESSAYANARFYICGHSYRGFEISPYSQGPTEPFGLKKQIEYQEDVLLEHVKLSQQASMGSTPKVILIGHSVGAYIMLEMIQRHWAVVEDNDVDDFDLIGGILLFPTIADIAKSPMGRIAKLVLRLPGFASIVGSVARGLGYILPAATLKGFVKLVTRFPEYAASTTSSFIKSSMGVRQALYLAKDEMAMIGKREWVKEVGLAKKAEGTNHRDTINWNLTLFWGKDDRWVAEATKERIKRRNSMAPRPVQTVDRSWNMVEDQEGLPHDFCTTLRNSNIVAGKVSGWIDEIIQRHNDAL